MGLASSIVWKLEQKFGWRERSIVAATKEQGLQELAERLAGVIPDLKKQYTTWELDSPFLQSKVRLMHAFQTSLVMEAVAKLDDVKTIVDIGDSSGAHLLYLREVLDHDMQTLSVNLDPVAVEKIQACGLPAICARAEELCQHDVDADLFLLFETLEHFSDPSRFLHELATKTSCKGLVLTVPYIRQSRVGMHHIRSGSEEPVGAERTHYFELSPADWTLLARHSGWRVVVQRISRQYPSRHPLAITRTAWRDADFEGFLGLVLVPDLLWAERYLDW